MVEFIPPHLTAELGHQSSPAFGVPGLQGVHLDWTLHHPFPGSQPSNYTTGLPGLQLADGRSQRVPASASTITRANSLLQIYSSLSSIDLSTYHLSPYLPLSPTGSVSLENSNAYVYTHLPWRLARAPAGTQISGLGSSLEWHPGA